MLVTLLSNSLSEQATWDCPECGRKGNTGNYCGYCAHAAPWIENAIEPTITTEALSISTPVSNSWNCPECSITGITGNYCEECFYPAPWIEEDEVAAKNIQSRLWFYHAVGSIVTFGHYEQDNDTSDGAEEIEWTVLKYDKTTHKSLLISRYGLDAMPYDTSANNGHLWESCTLNAWMNSEFINNAFSTEEQSAIALLDSAGNVSQSQIFILSSGEIETFIHGFPLCTPTDYAIAKGAYDSKRLDGSHYGWWWLRSDERQKYINHAGNILEGAPSMSNVAVRPTIWLDLELFMNLKLINLYKQVIIR